ncbi:MBL fold metallo-hydrolase [Clostridium sporogenes]|nr:MBL fold metallo-hydrolase [Clostridium sporogenes]NFS24819.1 MBL fold metallo-hydrolase [Clostridium sporogenes]
MAVEIRVLKALQGDCIWIRYGEEKFTNIVIDSGPKEFKNKFKELIYKIKNKRENIDLLVLTHIDNDHIGGVCEVLKDKEMQCDCIKKIWINTATKICECFNLKEYIDSDCNINVNNVNQIYTPQIANNLINIIIQRNIEVEQLIMVDDKKINLGDAEIIILSPTKRELENMVKKWAEGGMNTSFSSESWNEVAIDTIIEYDKFNKDTNKYNGSSIAFILKYNDISIVLLGDAYSHTVANTMKDYYKGNKLTVDLIKLSHHGSSSNSYYDSLDKFNCSNYLISTNGTNANPDKRTIARLIKVNDRQKINLYSNYKWWENKNYFTKLDQQKYIKTEIINRVELGSDMIKIKEGLLIGNE